jgi:hypothetical protein
MIQIRFGRSAPIAVMAAITTGKMDRNNEIARKIDRGMVMTQTSVGYQPPLDDRSSVGR